MASIPAHWDELWELPVAGPRPRLGVCGPGPGHGPCPPSADRWHWKKRGRPAAGGAWGGRSLPVPDQIHHLGLIWGRCEKCPSWATPWSHSPPRHITLPSTLAEGEHMNDIMGSIYFMNSKLTFFGANCFLSCEPIC